MHNRIGLLFVTILGLAVIVACGAPTTPPTVEYDLTVTLAGTGTGTVTSAPAGIATGDGDFEATFDSDTTVTLTADAADGSTFAGFAPAAACGDGSDASTCVVTMSADRSITATFTADEVAIDEDLVVTVNAAGDGAGSVVSDPPGIDTTDAVESATFTVGTEVTLTATVAGGGFAGWTGGACDGVKALTCTLTVGVGEAPVAANFNTVQLLPVLQIAAIADDGEEFLSDSDDVRNTDGSWNAGFTSNSSSDLELAFDPDHAPQIIGLRFVGVDVPAGANITSAVLGFTAFANPVTGSAGDVALTVVGEASATPGGFPLDPNPETAGAPDPSFNISSRVRTASSVAWNITDAWVATEVYESTNVGSVVTDIVALPDWTAGSALVLMIEGDPTSTEYRRAYSFATNPDRAPTLTLEFVALP